jgi:hypothetical protein
VTDAVDARGGAGESSAPTSRAPDVYSIALTVATVSMKLPKRNDPKSTRRKESTP